MDNFSFETENKIVRNSREDKSKKMDKEENFVSKLYSQPRDNFPFGPRVRGN